MEKMKGSWQIRKPFLEAGQYLLSGNEACALGAFDAGCRFFAGYPITPASEIMTELQKLFANESGATVIQMEDEIAALSTVIGASQAGAKSMTATSGPGFSLMQENIGYAVMTETPCVIIDVQRAGPSTGQPTRPAEGDLMQAIWGSHGDSQKIVLAPTTAQECYDFTILAFNLSEIYHTPVIILTNEIIAHLKEKVETPSELRLFHSNTPRFGEGHGLTITGATHFLDGTRAVADSVAQDDLLKRIADKMNNVNSFVKVDEIMPTSPEHDDLLVVTWGFASRSAKAAIRNLSKGRVGLAALKKLWPFPFEELARLEKKLKKNTLVIVPEMNQGQLIHFVRQIFRHAVSYSQTDGLPITPRTLTEEFKKWGIK